MNDSLNVNYAKATTVINPFDTNMIYLATSQQSVWVYEQIETSTHQPEVGLPTEYSLSQNYPNPFNSATTIKFALPEAGEVSLTIYDILGREVKRPVSGYKEVGRHSVTVDLDKVCSGVYFYILTTEKTKISRAMVFVK